MKCSQCGRDIDEIDVYCRWCGKSLSSSHIKKPYSFLALILISFLILINSIGLFTHTSLFFENILFLSVMLLISGLLLALSIVGIVHSVSCRKKIGYYYGLSNGIVACSLSGCFILFEIICILLRL